MAEEEAWPPRSPHAALLSSPSGRRKYLSSDSHSLQQSPQKHSTTTPNLLDRLSATRTNNDHLEQLGPTEEEEEDEETLKLQLAAIEAKLKLKKLQQSKTKADLGRCTPRPSSCRPSSADGTTHRHYLGDNERVDPEQPSQDVLVGVSPSKRSIPILEPRSPSRVLLGIDKGIKGSDVSLKRARTTVDHGRTRRADESIPSNSATSRSSGNSSHRSTTRTTIHSGSIKSFSERMASVREGERCKEAQRHSASLSRLRGFDLDQAELQGYRQSAEENPKRRQSPVRPGVQQVYSREEVLRAKENADSGSKILKKSRTAPGLRQSPTRPPSRGHGRVTPNAAATSQPDSSLYEGFSGLHLASRILPHSFLKRTLPEDQYKIYRIPDLLQDVKSPDYELPDEVGNYVVFGVIASKSTPRDHKQKVEEMSAGTNDWERKWEDGSLNHRKFIAITLTDLDWSLDLYLFGTAVPRYHRITPGTVVAILNPSIMPPKKGKEDSGAFSLALHDGDDTVLEIGTAKHLGYCTSRRKDGLECGQWVNAAKTEICEWHLNLQLSKTQSRRMGVNTGSNGTKLNSHALTFDSCSKGMDGGERQSGLLPRIAGQQFDGLTGSHYFVSNSNPGFSARNPQQSNVGSSRMLDPDDPFIAEGQLSRDKKTLLKLRKERQQKEDDIARKLSAFDSGRAGAEYMRHRTGTATPSSSQVPDRETGSIRSALAAKVNIMRSKSDANESRKRAADSVRLSPVKKTRFITEKGIRVAGRESLGVANTDDDDDLDIV